MENPATRTTRNNVSNCTIRDTCINTCSRKATVVLLHRAKWYDFVATNNMKIEFPSIDPVIIPFSSFMFTLFWESSYKITSLLFSSLFSLYNRSTAQFTKSSFLRELKILTSTNDIIPRFSNIINFEFFNWSKIIFFYYWYLMLKQIYLTNMNAQQMLFPNVMWTTITLLIKIF